MTASNRPPFWQALRGTKTILLTARGPYSGNGEPYCDKEGNAYQTVACYPHRVGRNGEVWERVADGGRGRNYERGYYAKIETRDPPDGQDWLGVVEVFVILPLVVIGLVVWWVLR